MLLYVQIIFTLVQNKVNIFQNESADVKHLTYINLETNISYQILWIGPSVSIWNIPTLF